MNINRLFTPPGEYPPGEIIEMTVGAMKETAVSAANAAVDYAGGKSPAHFWFRGEIGCGKSHLLALIRALLTEAPVEWIYLHPGNCAASNCDEIYNYVKSVLSHNSSSENIEEEGKAARGQLLKMIMAVEEPYQIWGAGLEDVLRGLPGSGLMLVFADSRNPPEGLDYFQRVEIPVLNSGQITEMLRKRSLEEKQCARISGIFDDFSFLPHRPLFIIESAKISLLNEGAVSEKVIECLLDVLSPRYSQILAGLSSQQKRILMTMASAEEMLTPGEIAAAIDNAAPVVNAQMKRLRDMGIVEYAGGVSGGGYQVFSDLMFRHWIYKTAKGRRSGLFDLVRSWRRWRELNLEPEEALFTYIRENHCPRRHPVDEVCFLVESRFLPQDKYESLSKTAAGYLRSGKVKKLEALLENESERSLNLGQKLRAARCMMLTAVCRILMGRYEGAFSALKSSYNHGERHPLFWINMGGLYFQRGDYSHARDCYFEGIKSSDKYPHPYYGIGAILRREEALEKAEEYIDRALKVNPKFSPGLAGKGNIEWEKGELSKALFQFDNAVSADETNFAAGAAAADLAFEEKRYSLCAKYCGLILEKCGEKDIKSEIAKQALAAFILESIRRVKSADFGQAEKVFAKALSLKDEIDAWVTEEILTRYFFALAEAGGSAIWDKQLTLCENSGLGDLRRRLYLFSVALKCAEEEGETISGNRIFPEARQTFQSIISRLSGG